MMVSRLQDLEPDCLTSIMKSGRRSRVGLVFSPTGSSLWETLASSGEVGMSQTAYMSVALFQDWAADSRAWGWVWQLCSRQADYYGWKGTLRKHVWGQKWRGRHDCSQNMLKLLFLRWLSWKWKVARTSLSLCKYKARSGGGTLASLRSVEGCTMS